MPVSTTDAFAHIRRMRDNRFPHEIASILPGEYFVSETPMIVYTVLGSCISACVRDPVAGVGGMNHFMLPAPKGEQGSDSWGLESTRYGSYAMEMLVNDVLKRGGLKSRLEVKLFGGGKIYEGNMDVGRNNIAWVRDYLKREGLAVAGADVGDIWPRKVYYFTESGRVLMKKIERVKNRTIMDREEAYAKTLKQEPAESEVTLF
ncbi:MAG: chemoreceptor glutamine deamidase CheD [Nitrospira sp.]|nr:chemoreceptor glutamine deamidase CheD [Nitrospira sp.]